MPGMGGFFGWKLPPPAAMTTTLQWNFSPPSVSSSKVPSSLRFSPVTIWL